MKKLSIYVSALAILASCTTLKLDYSAKIPKKKEFTELKYCENIASSKKINRVYQLNIDTTGHAIACALTAIFYGGWCWAYNSMPFDNQIKKAKKIGRELVAQELNTNPRQVLQCVENEKINKSID